MKPPKTKISPEMAGAICRRVITKLGSRQRVADYFGVSPKTIYNWAQDKNGMDIITYLVFERLLKFDSAPGTLRYMLLGEED